MTTALDRTLSKIKLDPKNKKLHRRLARDLGDEFRCRRLEVLSKFITDINRINDNDPYLEALSDICTAYESSIEEEVKNDEFVEKCNSIDFSILELIHCFPSIQLEEIQDRLLYKEKFVADQLQKHIRFGTVDMLFGGQHQLSLRGRRILRLLSKKENKQCIIPPT